MSKKPLNKGWQDEATTDPATISRWFTESPRINYGVRTGLENNLLVVDLDGTTAQQWWSSQGIASSAKVTTPSGPDRTHLYFHIYDVEISNSQSAMAPKVDTRGEGGYVVGPGSMVSTGTYQGDIRKITDAPEELLRLIPEKQVYTSIVREGEKTGDPTDSELRQIQAGITALEQLVQPWVEGAGWRSTFYRVACWFSRMVNSPDYALTEGGALDILMTHVPSDEQWGQPEAYEQWLSAIRSTVGQYAEPPTESIPNLLPKLEAINALPELTSTGHLFTSLVFDTPEGGATEYWKTRRAIFVESFRAGLSPEQAVTVVWNSTAGQPMQGDMNGLAMLWVEAEKARASVAAELGTGIEAPAENERPKLSLVPNRMVLMTDEERAIALQPWWGTRYLDWVESRVALMNPPYHRLNRWIILAVRFAKFGFLPHKSRPIGLNIFGLNLGKSTTGKTEGEWLMESVIKACFTAEGMSPIIGGNASPNALIEKLIERDGLPSLFITDEAHGLFKQMQGDASWLSGLKELLAKLFEGEVPIILRNGKKDLSGKDATTFFTAYLSGTVDGLTKVLDEDMWISGLLPRFVWAVGDEIEADDDTYKFSQTDSSSAHTYDEMPKVWAAEFKNTEYKLGEYGTFPLRMMHDQQAADRHEQLERLLAKVSRGHRQEELLKPTMIRFGINVRKIAILAAMVEQSPIVTLQHELIAIEQAEEWLTNIFAMVEQTTASAFSKSVDDIERFIATQRNQEARLERVYSHFKLPVRFMDEYITQLVREGRIAKLPQKDDMFLLKIKTQLGAIAA